MWAAPSCSAAVSSLPPGEALSFLLRNQDRAYPCLIINMVDVQLVSLVFSTHYHLLEFTCTVTLMFLFVVDSYLEDVLCAACRRCVELFKFNTESTALGYARGAEMARLVPLGRSTQ